MNKISVLCNQFFDFFHLIREQIIYFCTEGLEAICLGANCKPAEQFITHSHCTVGHVKRKPSRTVAKGRVISQQPSAGTYTASNTPVGLVVSTG